MPVCKLKHVVPPNVRLSLGTAIVLKLISGKLNVNQTTAYLMTYYKGKCNSNCSFCSQAKNSKSDTDHLSRVSWPLYPTSEVLIALTKAAKKKKIHRVCIQSLNYTNAIADIEAIVKEIKRVGDLNITVSFQPQNLESMLTLKSLGVERLGIALDGVTKTIFNNVKGGCYLWEDRFYLFRQALEIFGKGNVTTHLIIGLGEAEREAVETIQRCTDLGVLPALFAFTPVRGTTLEACLPPAVGVYRRIQLARYLIVNDQTSLEKMRFADNGKISSFGLSPEELTSAIISGEPFETSGCLHCNRPYYNEKVSGPIYNYPRKLNEEEVRQIQKELGY